MPESSLTINCEVMDSELLVIEKVLEKINERQGKGGVNLEAFRKEIIERFAAIGFRVEVKVYTTDQEGLYWFEIELADRLAGQFDPDRQVHDVTHDILELGDSGVINTKQTASGLHLIQGGKHSHRH